MKTIMELMILATTIPHHIPTRPPSSVIAKTRMNNKVKIIVRSTVAIKAFIPFPIPWKSDEESMPRDILG